MVETRCLRRKNVLTCVSISLNTPPVTVGLAVLQYRWSSQVSDAATTRIRTGLQNSMMNFRQDLSRELGTLCLELQAQPDAAGEDAKILAQKLEYWQRTSSAPALVDDLYFWTASARGDGTLFHVVLPEARFQPIAPWYSSNHREKSRRSAAAPASWRGGAASKYVMSGE